MEGMHIAYEVEGMYVAHNEYPVDNFMQNFSSKAELAGPFRRKKEPDGHMNGTNGTEMRQEGAYCLMGLRS
jgi:hypothetical protein